jgi:hypothetical protein
MVEFRNTETVKTPAPVTLGDATAAFAQIRSYFEGQDDPALPVPQTPEDAISAVVKHRRHCDTTLLEDAVVLNAWLDLRIAEGLRDRDERTLALFDACQTPAWNRVSYRRLGSLLGITGAGVERQHLRLQAAVEGKPRDATAVRAAKRPR